MLVGAALIAMSVKAADVVGWAQLTNEEAVALHVHPGGSTAPARFVSAGELELPVNFTTVDGERVFWDIDIACDLKRADGIEFDFYCSDSSPITGYSIYLKSGSGWYTGSFAPEKEGVSHRIYVDKSAMYKTEGSPRGWSKITGIRFGVWRGASRDSWLRVANLRVVYSEHDVLVVRGDMSARKNKTEDYIGQATAMTALMNDVGLAVTQVSDCDLDSEILEGVKLVVLPYNPFLPEGCSEILNAFVKRGGKILCCYSLAQGMEKALGLKSNGYRSATKYPEIKGVVGYRKSSEGLSGQPDFVAQASRNMMDVKLLSEGRVIANWVDVDNREVGTAFVETPTGYYLSHIWTARDEAARQMIRAIATQIDPTASARLAAAEAKARKREAEDAAWIASQVSKKGEWRAFWCHNELGLGGKYTWDDSIRILKENGFNAILPNLAWATKIYDIEPCLAACRKYGLECHIWKVCWRGNHRMKSMKIPGRWQRSYGGEEKRNWMCPSDPVNVAAEIEDFVKLAKFKPTGVHLDYIRYPDNQHCFCDGCRKTFEDKIGQSITNWPDAVGVKGAFNSQWLEFRRDNITKLVRGVSARVRQECPGVQVSAAVFHNVNACPNAVGQDWANWCREGLLDFVCPMDYYMGSSLAFKGLVYSQVEACRGFEKMIRPGLGLSCWKRNDRDARTMAEQIGVIREFGLDGFTVFDYGARALRILPILHTGPTR